MIKYIELAQPISIIFLVGLCLQLARNANGKLNKKVDRETCHAHVDNLMNKIDSLKEESRKMDEIIEKDVIEIKQDVKEILRRGI